ncbi:RrF2 family transcriptional regulator [Paenibacillus aquistagni]|uniref:RrF2 family transcriptional regulator n=1 Tax=Paenibacillus aquistagni TaxID=1852522 RepID=UPI000B513D31|nr:Rrf2 family transcriptional regulator [Paenibacillus aquistagni]NMM50940.1 Rrf2 family transcriptional regulator [Paenibacillus aquistagni]
MKRQNADKRSGTCPSTYKTFSLALQALVILGKQSGNCPSSDIAKYLDSEPTVLRRILAALAKEQMIEAKEGRVGGYRLAKDAEDITLADVYAVLHLHDARCSSMLEATGDHAFGEQMKAAMKDVLEDIDQSLMKVLNAYSIADLMGKIKLK